MITARHASLVLAVVAFSCARRTGAAQKLHDRGIPSSFTQLVVDADALQPERAVLDVRATGCDGGAMHLRRSDPATYDWRQGAFADRWNSGDEFRVAAQALPRKWDSCVAVNLYFSCLTGADTAVGATAECGDSLRAEKDSVGPIRLGEVVRHDN